jgi:hypothetical protein
MADQDELKKLRDYYQNILEKQREDYQNKLEKERESFQRRIKEDEALYKDELNDLKEYLQNKLEKEREYYQKRIEVSEGNYKDELKKKEDKYDEIIRKNQITNKIITAAYLLTAFILIVAIFGFAIPKHYDLEQKKLDLMQHQFDVQADQTNRSLQLQEASETIKTIETIMNSPIVDLLGTPKEISNDAKDLVLEIIKRFNFNVNLNKQLGDNKAKTSTETIQISPTKEPQNTSKVIPLRGNNNRENISFVYS